MQEVHAKSPQAVLASKQWFGETNILSFCPWSACWDVLKPAYRVADGTGAGSWPKGLGRAPSTVGCKWVLPRRAPRSLPGAAGSAQPGPQPESRVGVRVSGQVQRVTGEDAVGTGFEKVPFSPWKSLWGLQKIDIQKFIYGTKSPPPPPVPTVRGGGTGGGGYGGVSGGGLLLL